MTDKAATGPPDGPHQANADSTVGMTLYNVLAMHHGRAMNADQLMTVARNLQHSDLLEPQCDRALAMLLELGRIKNGADGYELVAKEGLFVAKRDLSDYNDKTMSGGWGGWKLKDPRIRDGQGVRPIEHLLRGVTE